MRLLRSPLTEKPRALRCSLLIRRKVSENFKNYEKKTPKPSKFIGNSSEVDTNVDQHAHPYAL